MADTKPAHQAPQELIKATPRFAQYTSDLLFGQIWERTDLANRDKSLVTCAALVAVNSAPYLQFHAARALDNGVSPRELSEMVTHLSFYCGWPMATAAAFELATVYENRNIDAKDVQPLNDPLLELEPQAEAARKAAVAAGIAPTSQLLAQDTDDVLFADLWRRPDLAPRDRSLATVVALIAMGQPEQMTFHINRAMDNGLTEAQLGAVISHLAYYVGWPRAVSAVGAARKILDDRSARNS